MFDWLKKLVGGKQKNNDAAVKVVSIMNDKNPYPPPPSSTR
jgi:hypothetical protein